MAFSNDGQFFSRETVVLTTWVRIRLLAIEDSDVYVAEATDITLLGKNFRQGLQCLFNDYARVEPVGGPGGLEAVDLHESRAPVSSWKMCGPIRQALGLGFTWFLTILALGLYYVPLGKLLFR